MAAQVRAIRGATTVDADSEEQVTARVQALVKEMLVRNDLAPDDLISVIFTTTPDVHARYPATAARELGLADVPLLGAQEAAVDGGLARCIRVLMHVATDRRREEIRHVYLEGARHLRDDLPA